MGRPDGHRRGTKARRLLWATVMILRFKKVPSTGVVQMGGGDPQGSAVVVQVT